MICITIFCAGNLYFSNKRIKLWFIIDLDCVWELMINFGDAERQRLRLTVSVCVNSSVFKSQLGSGRTAETERSGFKIWTSLGFISETFQNSTATCPADQPCIFGWNWTWWQWLVSSRSGWSDSVSPAKRWLPPKADKSSLTVWQRKLIVTGKHGKDGTPSSFLVHFRIDPRLPAVSENIQKHSQTCQSHARFFCVKGVFKGQK